MAQVTLIRGAFGKGYLGMGVASYSHAYLREETDMYEAPKLVKFGTFREMTQGKDQLGGDITPGWTGGMDCEPGISCRS